MARDSARKGELPEELPQPFLIPSDVGVNFAVRAFEISVRYGRRAAVARTEDIDGIESPVADHPVHMRVDEVQPRCRSPVAEQARLHIFGPERVFQQWVVEQVDLTDRDVVRGPPVRVNEPRICRRQHTILQLDLLATFLIQSLQDPRGHSVSVALETLEAPGPS